MPEVTLGSAYGLAVGGADDGIRQASETANPLGWEGRWPRVFLRDGLQGACPGQNANIGLGDQR